MDQNELSPTAINRHRGRWIFFIVVAIVIIGILWYANLMGWMRKNLGGGYFTDGWSIYVIDKCEGGIAIDAWGCDYSQKKVDGADLKTFQIFPSDANWGKGFCKR